MELTVRKRDAGRNKILAFCTGYRLPDRVDDIINREMDRDLDAVLIIHRTRPGDREEFKNQQAEKADAIAELIQNDGRGCGPVEGAD